MWEAEIAPKGQDPVCSRSAERHPRVDHEIARRATFARRRAHVRGTALGNEGVPPPITHSPRQVTGYPKVIVVWRGWSERTDAHPR